MTTIIATEPLTTARKASRTLKTIKQQVAATPLAPPPTLAVEVTITTASSLKEALDAVMTAVVPKSTMPVLGHVLLKTAPGSLMIAATDLHIAITHQIAATVATGMAITVPAKLLSDVVGSLPNEPIDLTHDARTQTLHLRCGRFDTTITGIAADEFPTIPTMNAVAPLTQLSAALLRGAIAQVARAASTDDTRPVLTGVLVQFHDHAVQLVATDGFRLATRTLTCPQAAATACAVIVPARALLALKRVVEDRQTIDIVLAPLHNHILFRTAQSEVVSRLIDGRFPEYERSIPQSSATRAVVKTDELRKAVKLASFFATSSANIVKLLLAAERLQITANAPEVGENRGEVAATMTGAGGEIALDVRYLSDALATITTPEVALDIQTPQTPAVIRPVGQDGYLHLVMPMTVR